jgi:hypothetical protein
MLKLTLNDLSDVRSTNLTAFQAILDKMQETIDAGDTIEITGPEIIILRTQTNLDTYLERFE